MAEEEEKEEFRHRFVPTNGLHLHIAELGSGPAVLLLHGFPEIWYSWRHQIRALSAAGYHAIAPDFRGYGLTNNPEPHKNSYFDLLDDIIGLLDAIGENRVFLVAKDFGAFIGYHLARRYPHRVKGLVVLGIPYVRHSQQPSLLLPDGHYLKRWAEPGRPEADFARFDVSTVIKRIYILFCNADMPIATPDMETLDLVDSAEPLPEWMTDQDLKVYAELYEKSGFAYPMEVPYRCWQRAAVETTHLHDYTITVPVLLIAGQKDYAMKLRPLEKIMATMKTDIPRLEVVEIEEGTHFVQEQLPEQVNGIILDFFSRSHSKS